MEDTKLESHDLSTRLHKQESFLFQVKSGVRWLQERVSAESTRVKSCALMKGSGMRGQERAPGARWVVRCVLTKVSLSDQH